MDNNSSQQPNNTSTLGEAPESPAPLGGPVPASPTDGPQVLTAPHEPQNKPKAKKLILLVVVLLVLIAGAVGALLWRNNNSSVADNKEAATPTKVYKVGVLDGLDGFFGESLTGFKQKMTKLGYVEGKNITYDVSKPEALTGNQAILKKFVDHKVDLIVAWPTEPSLEAEEATKGTQIPIISLNASTEGTSLIDSIKHPGHNLTGVRFPGPEDSVKRLQILHQLDPAATRVLVPYLKDYPNVPSQLIAMQTAADTLGQKLTVVPLDGSTAAGYVAGLSATSPGFDAIVGPAEPFAVTPALNSQLFTFAHQHQIPVLAGALSTDDTGPIVSVGPSSSEVGSMGASLADKIFKGADTGALPILTPTSYLQVNLKVAQKLGITPDAGLLSTATKIVR
jgi:putative ABC transport system substrate-binding protein